MTTPIILLEASPRRISDGVAVNVRLAGGGGQRAYDYNGQVDWRAGIVQLPTFVTSIDFAGAGSQTGEFGSGGVPQAAEIQWSTSKLSDLAQLSGYFWYDAPVTIRIGPEGSYPAVTLTGKVLDAKPSGGVLTIALSDPTADLKKPLLTARYAGTGGLEGPVEWEGKIRRRIWGRVWNVALEPIDKANNIYCASDPLLPIQAFDAVRDQGAAAASLTTVAWAGSAAATLAALQAAAAPDGGGVTCPSISCVKWWTQPNALNADVRGEIGAGYVETTAAIVQRIIQAGANTPFASGTVAAAASARPAPVGWVAKDDSTTQASMIEELLGNSSLLWLLDGAGQIVLREWAWGSPVASAISQDVKRIETLAPVAFRQLGYRRNETVMARGDLAAIVLTSGTVDASDVLFGDGTTVENLKPAEIGSNKTETRVAAAIASQGPLATAPSATPYDNANVATGVNALVNSELTVMDPQWSATYPFGFQAGWLGNSSNLGSVTIADSRQPMGDGGFGFARVVTGNPNGTAIDLLSSSVGGAAGARRFALPVKPGDTVAVSALIGLQNLSNAAVIIGFVDENGDYVSEHAGNAVTTSIGSAAFNTIKRGDLGESWLVMTVPADGSGSGTGRRRWAYMWVRTGLNGTANPRAIMAAPLLTRLPAGQVARPPYTPGPPDRQATYGATTGYNVSSVTYGSLTDAQLLTALGIAAGFSGQAAWATFTGLVPTTVAGQVQRLDGSGNLESSYIFKSSVGWLNTFWPGEGGANVTETRVAASFSGQAAWATYTGLAPSTVAGQVQRLDGSGNLESSYIYKASVGWLVSYWPQEGGANVTEIRVAIAISGQGALATQNSATWSTQVTGSGKPEDSADVTSGIIGQPEVTVAASHTGTVTEAMPKTVPYKLSRNGVDVTTSYAWSVSVLSGTMSASIGAATGILSLNTSGGALTSGEIEITAVLGTVTRKERKKIKREDGLPPAYGAAGGSAGGGGFSGATGANTTLAGPINGGFTIIIGGGGQAALQGYYQFSNAESFGTGPWEVQTQVGRWNGSGWTMLGSPVVSSGPYYPGSGFPGNGGISYTDTGRTPGAAEKYGLFIADYISSPPSGDNLLSGSFVGQGS